jgi:hypothetical protein
MIAILLPLALAVTNPKIDTVYNSSKINQIDGRDVRFGVSETVEELILDANVKHENAVYSVEIVSIESPQEMLNIAGTQWLKKNYVVKVDLIHDGKYYYGEGKRKTTLFAMFLDVEGGEAKAPGQAIGLEQGGEAGADVDGVAFDGQELLVSPDGGGAGLDGGATDAAADGVVVVDHLKRAEADVFADVARSSLVGMTAFLAAQAREGGAGEGGGQSVPGHWGKR